MTTEPVLLLEMVGNVLSLRNELSLDAPQVLEEQLLSVVAERLLNSTAITDKEERERVVTDVLNSLDQLTTGVDVDPIFTRIDGFEFEGVSRIFRLLGIVLYHGWIIHPMDSATQTAIGENSYNKLVQKLAVLDTEITEKGKRIEEFLQKQLTMTGLQRLRESMQEKEPCVFYWNKHFYTLVVSRLDLFTLVTDQGFLDYPDHVWQKLETVDGPTGFYNFFFGESRPIQDLFNSIPGSATSGVSNYKSNEESATDFQQEVDKEEEPVVILPVVSAPSRMWFPATRDGLRLEFEGIKLPVEVMDKIVKEHFKSLKAFVKLASTSKRMSDFVFSIKDIELTGDDQEGTLAEKNLCLRRYLAIPDFVVSIKDIELARDDHEGTLAEKHFSFPSYIGILKCVGMFDSLKFERLSFAALKARSVRALSAFKSFSNLKTVSLKFPPMRREMDEFTGYYWKIDFKVGVHWFIFMSPMSVTPPEGINTGRAEVNRRMFEMDEINMRKKLKRVCGRCYGDGLSAASMISAIVMQLPHLEMISITGKDERRIGNIYLHGDKLNLVRAIWQKLGGRGYNVIDFTERTLLPRKSYIANFTAPESQYVFTGVTVFLLRGIVVTPVIDFSRNSCEELLNSDTVARDGGTLIESAYMELLRFVLENVDSMEEGMSEIPFWMGYEPIVE